MRMRLTARERLDTSRHNAHLCRSRPSAVPAQRLPVSEPGLTLPSFWNQRPDWALTPQRQAYFSDLIVDALAQGPLTRESLKDRCRAAGMTQAEEGSIFHPWGGGIRELCERGFLCGMVSEEKAFRLCPAFTPMEERCAAGADTPVFYELRPGLHPGRSLLFRFLAGGDQKAAGPASRGSS